MRHSLITESICLFLSIILLGSEGCVYSIGLQCVNEHDCSGSYRCINFVCSKWEISKVPAEEKPYVDDGGDITREHETTSLMETKTSEVMPQQEHNEIPEHPARYNLLPNEVFVQPGEFIIGSPSSETWRAEHEGPQHLVKITRPFAVYRYEVTQKEFFDAMGYNPSSFVKCGQDCPVEKVNWHEALSFCNVLSYKNGLEECYTCQGKRKEKRCVLNEKYAKNHTYSTCPGYRLPTSAEWEYFARAGSLSSRYDQMDNIGWYFSNSGMTTHPVGKKKPNVWGIYDSLGNTWEWVFDSWKREYAAQSVSDPVYLKETENKEMRGGGWINYDIECRFATRKPNLATYYDANISFRPVRTLFR